MFKPRFRTKRNGVPVISRKEIDVIASSYVRAFQPQALVEPQMFRIEEFIECCLQLNMDYQYLSHNGVYLGMTVFNDTDRIPVYCPETNTAEYIHADAHTVIIDCRLIEDEKQEHRYRYTLGHEAGHEVFHAHIFVTDPNQVSLWESASKPMIRCREDSSMRRCTNTVGWTDQDWMEWHANAFSSALLMPSDAVDIIYRSTDGMKTAARNSAAIGEMVRVFNVSTEAATYRLKDLGYIRQEDRTDYLRIAPYFNILDIDNY